MLSTYSAWVLQNFSLAMFLFAAVITFFHKIFFWRRLTISEIVYRWFSFFALGLTELSLVVGPMLGLGANPLQYEVAVADLGFGLMAVLSFRANYSFRLATVIGNTCWLWGNAFGHIYQGYVGTMLYLDIVLPLMLILCMLALRPKKFIKKGA